jgi:hypothetical protein
MRPAFTIITALCTLTFAAPHPVANIGSAVGHDNSQAVIFNDSRLAFSAENQKPLHIDNNETPILDSPDIHLESSFPNSSDNAADRLDGLFPRWYCRDTCIRIKNLCWEWCGTERHCTFDCDCIPPGYMPQYKCRG